MTESKPLIRFNIQKITTEQFAIAGEMPSEKSTLNFISNIEFKPSLSQQSILVFSKFSFEEKNKPFLIIEGSCLFGIYPEDWKTFFKEENNSFIVPKDFLIHLAMLTVGTTRGILHSKTEGTPYNRFFIPPINLKVIVKEDLILNKEAINA